MSALLTLRRGDVACDDVAGALYELERDQDEGLREGEGGRDAQAARRAGVEEVGLRLGWGGTAADARRRQDGAARRTADLTG